MKHGPDCLCILVCVKKRAAIGHDLGHEKLCDIGSNPLIGGDSLPEVAITAIQYVLGLRTKDNSGGQKVWVVARKNWRVYIV